MIKLIEIEPGRWRVDRREIPVARSTRSKVPGRPKGVYWHKQRQRWHSNITIGGKKRHLGLFGTEADAAAAFERASREVYREFARVEAKPCAS
jgi:hypothetical protein